MTSSLDRAIALHRTGDLLGAQRLYREVLEGEPDLPDALGLLGVVESQLGRHDQATRLLEQAARAAPGSAMIRTNLAQALNAAGREPEAIEEFRVAAELSPEPGEVRFRLGTLLLEQGRAPEAAIELERALTHDPESTATWQNLAAAHYRAADLTEAERCYRRALELDPDNAAVLHGLGQVLRASGDVTDAIGMLWEGIRKDPGNRDAWSAFAETFGGVEFDEDLDVAAAESILEACLLHDAVDPESLAPQVTRVLGRDPVVGALLEQPTPERLERLADLEVWEHLARPVLVLALRLSVLPDLRWEGLLKDLRRALVTAVAQGVELTEAQRTLLAALGAQCAFNGWVWSWTEGEVEAVERIATEVAGHALGELGGDETRILAIASYVPLLEWERAGEVLALAEHTASPVLLDLAIDQVLAPLEERELAETFQTGPVEEGVSGQVRAFYEEHPYPRWKRAAHRTPRPLATILQERGAVLETVPPDRPRVLVAGCGTGKHIFEVRGRYAHARIQALDLSSASLGFAARMLREAGIEDVALTRSNLLDLDPARDRFDVVESVGVLHHLEDPLAGWRRLVDCLEPGGLMRIGLYSAFARKPVEGARAALSNRVTEGDAESLRMAREHLIGEGHAEFTGLFLWRDFYSLQEFRDLVLHVQEHRFTIPELARAMEELDLEFLGFDLPRPAILARFKEAHPATGSERDLGAWDAFERAHPRAFANMYVFWARKR